MKFRSALSFVALLTGAAAMEPKDAGGLERHAEWVQKLSSESFREREEASQVLWEKGEEALEALRAGSKSDDPEVAKRAGEVLEKVELRITPETAPEILEQIRRLRTAPTNLKSNHIGELRRRKAYFQILKLYSMEKNPEVRSEMAGMIRGIAMIAAREALAGDDFETAIQLLMMSAKEPNDLVALAWVYRTMGRLDKGKETPPAPEGVPTEIWEITIRRVQGDLDGALRLATEARQTRLEAGLKVLTGDPTSWIRANGFGERRARALAAYNRIALMRWNGDPVKDADFAPLVDLLNDPEAENYEQAVSSLAALGRLQEVEKNQEKWQPEIAFIHYLAQERIDEALNVLGIDPEKPDFKKWAAERFPKLWGQHEDDEEANSPLTSLLIVASFLETRGLHQELEAAYSEHLKKYAEEDSEGFIDFLRSLYQVNTGAPRFAYRQGKLWAGDDANRWGELISAAFGDEEHVGEWLNWINELSPEASKSEVFEIMLALFGMAPHSGKQADEWLAKAWTAATDGPEDKRNEHLLRIRTLALARQDVAMALRTFDERPDGAEVEWPGLDKYLSAAGRWKEAAAILQAKDSESPEYHAYLAATLRRAGDEKGAARHDALAEKFSLGYSLSCARIADHYLYGGDPERAGIWARRAAMHADIMSSDFITLIEGYAQHTFQAGEWQVAASCYEALIQAYAGERFSGSPITQYAKIRLQADLAKALSILPSDRNLAIERLRMIHSNFKTDGVLADDFFPALRKAGLRQELKQWFTESWEILSAVIERFPDCDNTRNTAAWLASRAGLKLPEAEKHLQIALAKSPHQAAYLDTMAEVRFAMGDREGAVRWSNSSLLRYPLTESPNDTMIRRQNHRFRTEPLPNR